MPNLQAQWFNSCSYWLQILGQDTKHQSPSAKSQLICHSVMLVQSVLQAPLTYFNLFFCNATSLKNVLYGLTTSLKLHSQLETQFPEMLELLIKMQ